jgi:hypothetical protein
LILQAIEHAFGPDGITFLIVGLPGLGCRLLL